MRLGTAILVVGLEAVGLLIPISTPKAFPKNETRNTPSYAGFAEIRSTRNSFMIAGDTQGTSHWEFWRERNDRERKLIVDEITRREPAFVIHLGDLTTRGSSLKHWQEFDDRHKEFREKKIPYFPVLGNHEFYGNDEKGQNHYFQRFPHLEKRRWYSFIWKHIGFLLLDSNFPSLTREQVGEQSRWYLGKLEEFQKGKEVDLIIVCCHQPPFTNSRMIRPNKEVEVNFADPFLQFQKTRLFFSGHSHSYERFQKKGRFFIVSGGGGGPRHELTIDPRKQRSQDLFTGPERRFFHFCEIKSDQDTLAHKVMRLEPDEAFAETDPFILSRIRR